MRHATAIASAGRGDRWGAEPQLSWAHTARGGILAVACGRDAAAREEALISLRLNSRDRTGPTAASVLRTTYYFKRNYVAAADAGRRCLADSPSYDPPRRFVVAVLGQIGRQAEADAALREFLQTAPRVFDAMVHGRPNYVRAGHHEHMLEGNPQGRPAGVTAAIVWSIRRRQANLP